MADIMTERMNKRLTDSELILHVKSKYRSLDTEQSANFHVHACSVASDSLRSREL